MSVLYVLLIIGAANILFALAGYMLGTRRRASGRPRTMTRELAREAEAKRRIAARLKSTEEELQATRTSAKLTEEQLQTARHELLAASQEVNAARAVAVASRRQLARANPSQETSPAGPDGESEATLWPLMGGARPDNGSGDGLASESEPTEPMNFQKCVRAAIQTLWTGRMVVFARNAEEEKFDGEVFFVQGTIAWAACRRQEENLGSFLYRLGRVTGEDLKRARAIFEQHGGAKKLGAILEEEQIVERPVLRHCLMLHARQALFLLLEDPEALCSCRAVTVPKDEQFVFLPEEVLPLSLLAAAFKHAGAGQHWKQISDENVVLGPLSNFEGHLASAVVSWDGQLITAHLDPERINPHLLGVLVVSVVQAAERAISRGSVGDMQALTIRCSQGCLVAKWIDHDCRFLALLLLGGDQDATAAREKLEMAVPELQQWVNRQVQMQSSLEVSPPAA